MTEQDLKEFLEELSKKNIKTEEYEEYTDEYINLWCSALKERLFKNPNNKKEVKRLSQEYNVDEETVKSLMVIKAIYPHKTLKELIKND